MKKVNVFEIKAKLSEYLDLVESGERVVICRRNQPVAELRAVALKRTSERLLGGTELDIPSTFFKPLPADIEGAFYDERMSGGAASAAERATEPYTPARRAKRKRS